MKFYQARKFKFRVVLAFLVTIAFVSMTYAWFAYSAKTRLGTEVDVKAWYVEIEKDGSVVTNNVDISASEIYPGMDTVVETIKISNLGDTDAIIKYDIKEARILDKETYSTSESTTTESIEDILANQYPFKININLSKDFVISGNDSAYFTISISWPFDSDTDELDSSWGSDAYEFIQSENQKLAGDSSYQVRNPINLSLALNAEQYFEADNELDINYGYGQLVLFDVANNKSCSSISSTCLVTHVIDNKNKVSDNTVSLVLDAKGNYRNSYFNEYNDVLNILNNLWSANVRGLSASELLVAISKDVENTKLIRPDLSDTIVGNVAYQNRSNEILTRAITYNGHFTFDSYLYDYFSSVNCYWTDTTYNFNYGYGVESINDSTSKLGPIDKDTSCRVVPVIEATKASLK